MPQLDLKELAAKVSVEHGIRVDSDDPIMAVVTLNRLVLEQATNEIVEEVRAATRELEQAAEGVQVQAGTFLAQRVRDSVSVTALPKHERGLWRWAEPMRNQAFSGGLQ